MISNDTLVQTRAAVGAAFGLLELAAPSKVAAIDALGPGAEPLVRGAGLHKLATAAGLARGRDARVWIAAALAGSLYDGLSLLRRRAKPAAYARLAALAAFDLWLARRVSRDTPDHAPSMAI